MALFDEIRQLFKDLRDLKELKFYSSWDAFDKLATAIMEEKRTGASFDIRRKWMELTPLRFNISRTCHPFPHPTFTQKGQGPAAFQEYSKRRGNFVIVTGKRDSRRNTMVLS